MMEATVVNFDKVEGALSIRARTRYLHEFALLIVSSIDASRVLEQVRVVAIQWLSVSCVILEVTGGI